MINFKSVILIALVICGAASCFPELRLPHPKTVVLPDQYDVRPDSALAPLGSWRNYYNDTLLARLIDSALSNNYDLQQALARVEAARWSSREARSSLWPSITAVGMWSQRKFGLYTMDGAGNITTDITPGKIVPTHLQDYYPSLAMSWEVDVWGKLKSRKRAAYSRYLVSESVHRALQTEVIAEVAVHYYTLVAMDNILDAVEKNVNLREQMVTISRVQKEAGLVNELAVQQFVIQLQDAQVLKLTVQAEVIRLENNLNLLLGRVPANINRNAKRTSFAPGAIAGGVPSALLRNRPDVMAAEQELLATKADAVASKANFYPSFQITGAAGFQAFNAQYLFLTPESIAYGLFGSLTAPLINRAAIKAEYASANARQVEAICNYQKTVLSAFIEVNTTYALIENVSQARAIVEFQANDANTAVEIAKLLFQTGRADYLEVVNVQERLLETQVRQQEMELQLALHHVVLYRALGGGWN